MESLINMFNSYEIANKNLERKLQEEELSSTVIMGTLCRLEKEIRELKSEKEVLKESAEKVLANVIKGQRVHSRSWYKILMRMETKYAGLAMKMSQAFLEWG